ncbi:troponin-C isoform 6x [Penaeus vannamei]|uniref:Troponin-C isoform 6x n=1 Tax=Penaeus vannamei TaxID=6689 RepID=A0A423T1C8_PENVA|nr:troponin-C isoform 6x [Penaeus vannamei]
MLEFYLPFQEADLDEEKMGMLRKAFAMFDSGKTGKIEKEKIRTILNTLGASYINEELEALLTENDVDAISRTPIPPLLPNSRDKSLTGIEIYKQSLLCRNWEVEFRFLRESRRPLP